MQGKMHPLELNGVVGFEFFNTHGTEITPRSNVVSKDLQGDVFHVTSFNFRIKNLTQGANVANHLEQVRFSAS